jgi:hypothetical protein
MLTGKPPRMLEGPRALHFVTHDIRPLRSEERNGVLESKRSQFAARGQQRPIADHSRAAGIAR